MSSSCRSVLMAVGRNSLLLVDTVLVGLILIFLDEIGELLMIDTLDTLWQRNLLLLHLKMWLLVTASISFVSLQSRRRLWRHIIAQQHLWWLLLFYQILKSAEIAINWTINYCLVILRWCNKDLLALVALQGTLNGRLWLDGRGRFLPLLLQLSQFGYIGDRWRTWLMLDNRMLW